MTTTPVPPHLSDEERALWEKAYAVIAASQRDNEAAARDGGDSPRALWTNDAWLDAMQSFSYATTPEFIRSLLTALSSERTRADRWKVEAEQWEEREANCCPEDMSMEENIGALIRERDEARGALSTEREAGERGKTDAARLSQLEEFSAEEMEYVLSDTGTSLRDAIDQVIAAQQRDATTALATATEA